jgi:dihydroorotate dehydrogenase electron transfer subunit
MQLHARQTMNMIQSDVTVLWNRKLGQDYRHLALSADTGFEDAQPGQFVTVSIDQQPQILRRPFSIHRLIVENNQPRGLEILYRVVGPSTKRVAQLETGDVVNVLGPLGNGFTLPQATKRVYLVGGGIGVAPLLFWADYLRETGVDLSDCALFLGGRTETDLLRRDEFQHLGLTLHLSTDDGSVGHPGVITRVLETVLEKESPDLICACGPPAMLDATAAIAAKWKLPCQVSVETLMACGMGACLGCAVETVDQDAGYRHVCIDGPVFDARQLK